MNVANINLIFVGVFLAGTLFLWLRTIRLRKTVNWEPPVEYTLLCVAVPKNNERTPQAAEQMFAALHGIYREGATSQLKISLEIVSRAKSINFYLYVPVEIREFVSSQIFAQYPNVEIKEIALDHDYTIVEEGRALAATELTLKKNTVYPIKTFINFEVDPLSAITGVMSSIGPTEELWIQTIIQPISDDWQEQGIEEIKNVKEPPGNGKGFVELAANEAKNLTFDFVKNVFTGKLAEAPDDKKKEDKKKELGGPVEQAMKGIEEKITKLGFSTNIRVLAFASDDYAARAKLEQVVGAYKQYNTLNLNSFTFASITSEREALSLFHDRTFAEPAMIFNITELASIYHYPSQTVSTPTIAWAGSKKGEPPANLPIMGEVPADDLTVFGQTNFRNEVRRFGIKRKDRRLHMYIIGKTGTGKSTLMENMIIDDIREGRGVAVVDPHGTLIQHVLEFIPENRVDDVIYFNPSDYERPVGFNLLENVNPEQKNIVASGVVGILEKIFGSTSWGPRLEYILRNVVLALLEYKGSTFLGIMRILTDNAYRRMVINEVKDPIIRDFFINEYEKYDPKFRTEAIAPIQNKVGQFLSSSTIRNIIGQPHSTMDIRKVMDEGKILLADLSIGKIGEDNSALLGSMLITKIQLAAMGRVDLSEEDRRDFYLYVDEFQNFATDSFATILSEARKYRLNLAMANQYTAQMPETVSSAVFGNVGTIISFRVGASDADALVKEYEPVFDANDLVNLDNFQIYLKMAIDGVTVPAFSAGTLPPQQDKTGLSARVIESSRRNYTRSVEEVEDYITEWSTPVNLGDEQGTAARKQPYDPSIDSGSPRVAPRGEQIKSSENKQIDEKVGESQPENQQVGESVSQQQGSELPEEPKVVNKPSMNLPEGMKIEILKDRFDRPWYAAKRTKEEAETHTETQGGGELEEKELITWERAEDLLTPTVTDQSIQPSEPVKSDDVIPLEEIA